MEIIFRNLWMIHKEEPFTKEELAFLFWLVIESANRAWHPVKRLLPVVACECGLSTSSVKTIRESLKKRNLINFEAGVNKNMPGTYSLNEVGIAMTLEILGLTPAESTQPRTSKRAVAKPSIKPSVNPTAKPSAHSQSKPMMNPTIKPTGQPGDRTADSLADSTAKPESHQPHAHESCTDAQPKETQIEGNLKTGTLDFK